MTRVLLDTCTFLWIDSADHKQIGKAAWKTLTRTDLTVCISLVTFWEIAIKRAMGKLPSERSLESILADHQAKGDVEVVPIGLNHIQRIQTPPLIHRDPFDRLLVAQAMLEKLPILSADEVFDRYDVERIWD